MCSSATLSTTNSTLTGPLLVKPGLDSDYALRYIIPCLNTELFLRPLQIHNGCSSLFYQTPPQLLHAHMVCRSPR